MTEGHTERLEAALDGKYRIERKLGEGGMATVYLAEDIKHERKVALKILKPELAAVIGAERFLSEIKTTANLQHPHILALFDSGEASGYLYYVMPYIEGETLRDKLDREKQLGVDESIRIARDVADALDYAHRQGVIHRDIKPANILLHDGRPVVADFGIALAVTQAGGGRMTATGLSLGTPHYMSPEQASADRDLSARSDVYSLGCVLYEMIGGQPPHTGPSAQSILVHILTEEATPLTRLRHTVPPHVAATVAKAIEKLPADRFETAKAFMDALGDSGFSYQVRPRDATSTQGVATPLVGRTRPWLGDRRSVAALFLCVTMTALAALGWLRPGPEPALPMRTEITGLDMQLDVGGWRLAISRDGRWLVAGHREEALAPALYVRSSDDTEWRRLSNTENGTNPTFSPDGQSVAFSAGGAISKVPITGGPALPIGEGSSPHWGLPDVIVYNDAGAIYRVGASGGEPELLFESDSIQAVRPHLLPNGKGIVFGTSAAGDPLNSRIMYLDAQTGEVRQLVASGAQPHYVSTGHLIYGHGSQVLMGVPFDADAGEVTGDPIILLTSLSVYSGGASQFAVSETGTLIYDHAGSASAAGAQRVLVEVDLEGAETPLPIRPGDLRDPRYSPDGSQIVFSDDEGVRIFNFANNTTPLLAPDRANNAIWSASGEYVYYRVGSTGVGDIYRRRADLSDEAELMSDRPDSQQAAAVSADDSILVVNEFTGPGEGDILLGRQGASGMEFEDFLASEWNEQRPSISPDGGWLAYQSDQSGEARIYVTSFPVASAQRDVSRESGAFPLWHPDGSTLYYQSGPQFMSVGVATEPTFSLSSVPRLLFENPSYSEWDIHPDGSRFVVVAPVRQQGMESAPATTGQFLPLYVVTNWFTELRDRMGEN